MSLPASAQEIAAVIGRERALYLIGQLPKCYAKDPRYTNAQSARVIMYVPKRLTFDHQLVRILGWADAQKLVSAFGGEILSPATCMGIYKPFRDTGITRLITAGVPIAMVAEWFGVSQRHVQNLAREIPQEDRRVPANDNAPSPTDGRNQNEFAIA